MVPVKGIEPDYLLLPDLSRASNCRFVYCSLEVDGEGKPPSAGMSLSSLYYGMTLRAEPTPGSVIIPRLPIIIRVPLILGGGSLFQAVFSFVPLLIALEVQYLRATFSNDPDDIDVTAPFTVIGCDYLPIPRVHVAVVKYV